MRYYLKFSATILLFLLVTLSLAVQNVSNFEGLSVTKINIEGLGFTKRHIVLRELSLKEGHPFSVTAFDADLKALEKLDVFAEIEHKLINDKEGVSINLKVKEIPLAVVHPTGEYTEENGLSLGLGLLSTNMWGRNHFCQFSYKRGFLGTGVERFSLEYEVPRISNKRIRVTTWLADEERDNINENFFEHYRIARVQLLPSLIYSSKYRLTAKVEGAFETVAADTIGITLDQDNEDEIPSLGASLMFDSRNFGGNPSAGIFGEAGIFQFGGFLGGESNYVQSLLDLRYYLPLFKKQHLLLSNLIAFQSGRLRKEIPVYRRFWLGGVNSVRGFSGMDRMKSGKNQWLLSAEYRFLLMAPRVIPLFLFDWFIDLGLQPVLGVDVGKSWDQSWSDNSWMIGCALGVQILVPYIQMVRFEYGFSPDSKEGVIKAAFHMSAVDKPSAQRFRRR